MEPLNWATVRPIKQTDRNYILSTWSKGILDAPPFRWMSDAAWAKQHAHMERLVDGAAAVVVAVNPDDEDQILGYVVWMNDGKKSCIHWVYVKKIIRGRGLCRYLLSLAIAGNNAISFSHYSRGGAGVARALCAEYDPFEAWNA